MESFASEECTRSRLLQRGVHRADFDVLPSRFYLCRCRGVLRSRQAVLDARSKLTCVVESVGSPELGVLLTSNTSECAESRYVMHGFSSKFSGPPARRPTILSTANLFRLCRFQLDPRSAPADFHGLIANRTDDQLVLRVLPPVAVAIHRSRDRLDRAYPTRATSAPQTVSHICSGAGPTSALGPSTSSPGLDRSRRLALSFLPECVSIWTRAKGSSSGGKQQLISYAAPARCHAPLRHDGTAPLWHDPMIHDP